MEHSDWSANLNLFDALCNFCSANLNLFVGSCNTTHRHFEIYIFRAFRRVHHNRTGVQRTTVYAEECRNNVI